MPFYPGFSVMYRSDLNKDTANKIDKNALSLSQYK